jgi:hypothetical protein
MNKYNDEIKIMCTVGTPHKQRYMPYPLNWLENL